MKQETIYKIQAIFDWCLLISILLFIYGTITTSYYNSPVYAELMEERESYLNDFCDAHNNTGVYHIQEVEYSYEVDCSKGEVIKNE